MNTDAKHTSIAVAVRTDFERNHWVHPLLVIWLIGLHAEETHQLVITVVHGAGGFAASSNACAYDFMDTHPDYEWLCIVDNDTVPPDDMLRILDFVPDDVDIVSPVAYMMRGDRKQVMQGFYREDAPGGFEPLDLLNREPGLYEVGRAGGGCCFYRRRVFEKMERPYFMVLFNKESQMMAVSDDAYCQNVAVKLGFKLCCDTRFVARHYHTVNLSDPG